MAVYRVEIDVSFKEAQDAIDFLNHVEGIKDKVHVESRGTTPIPVRTDCRHHKCYHDEDTPKPCGNYINVDFSAATKVHARSES
ncbi:MAG: hypothetical protein ABIH47_09110 [Candidatus Omnitrophota bacterium]